MTYGEYGNKVPIDEEIAFYYGIEERLVKNILLMYEYRGREGVISTTLSDKVIDEIIELGGV